MERVRGEEVKVQKMPRVGDRVTIPWGRDQADGEVIAVYETGYAPRATVSVFIEGTEEPVTVTVRIEWMEPTQAA